MFEIELSVPNQVPERRCRRQDAETEKAEARFHQNGVGGGDARRDQERAMVFAECAGS